MTRPWWTSPLRLPARSNAGPGRATRRALRHGALAAAVLLLCLPVGCRRDRAKAGAAADWKARKDEPVILLGDQVVTRRAFHEYVSYNMVKDPETGQDGAHAQKGASSGEDALWGEDSLEDTETRARMMSRLFDRFVTEKVLLYSAGRKGIVPAEAEVKAFVDSLGVEVPKLRKDQQEALRKRASEAVTIRKFLETEVLSGVQVADAEVDTYYKDHYDDFKTTPRYRFRWVHFNDRSEAEKAATRLQGRKARFEDISEEFQVPIEGGKEGPEGYWNPGEIPERFRAAVMALANGGISDVLEDPYGGFTIFELEDISYGAPLPLEKARPAILFRLKEEKARTLSEAYIANLVKEKQVRINYDKLGFTYVPES